MKRRDFVKGLAAAAAAGTALGQQKTPQATTPAPSTSAVDQGTMAVSPNAASSPAAAARTQQMAAFRTPNIPVTLPDVVATTDARYFTAARYATLVHLCEILMPGGGGYPSALQADTPQFLDFHVGGSPADRQAMYNDGLDRLNADSMKKFNIAFAETDAKQADAVIRPALKGWINDHPPLEKHERFVALAHREIRTATMNSPAWASAAEASGERTPGVGLYWAPIDPGIETWVSHGAPKASAPLTRQAHP
ncbi:gluconate 2-dehydrogenase subunit 3 family protein [Terriglobus tenax]|uniref:gluconate 2-dehydrogenase subunit 3 family protein n=1 Tax=Terriglobus tenax TaxID=1111115 RepID=UPI0021DF8DC6|nr:gluconate 2-dehydrogenase subunit 3 family protein [Terriglobus tenax]